MDRNRGTSHRSARSLVMTFGGLLGVVACVEQGDQADELALDTESGDGSDDESNRVDDDDTPPMPGAPDAVVSPAADDAQPVSLAITDPHVRVVGGTGSCSQGTTCVNSVPMTGNVSTLFNTVDHSMRQFMQINCVGGGVLAFSRNGRRVYKRGFGRTKGAASAYSACANDDLNGLASPVRPDTPFPVASVTKFVTASAVRELLSDAGVSDPSAAKAIDHMPTYLRDYFYHTSTTGTCAPIPGYVRNEIGPPDDSEGTEDSNPRNCAPWAHPDDDWADVTIGDLIGHSSGFSWPSPGSGAWYDDIATLRSNTTTSEWLWSDYLLELRTDYPDELDEAREDILDELLSQSETLPGGGPIGIEDIMFVQYYNEEDYWTPVDDYLIRVAGNVLQAPGPREATDAAPFGKDTNYSNNGYRMLGRIAANVHVTEHGGHDTWGAPDGFPELHDDTALGWFLALNDIHDGVWSDEAIFARQFGYASGYVDPTPAAREWNASLNQYEWLERSWSRPWCLLDSSECPDCCDFSHWRSVNAVVDGFAPSWNFETGPLSSMVPFHRNEPNSSLSGTGDLAAEMPALLILLDRYYVQGDDGLATRMGMRLDDWQSLYGDSNWSMKDGEVAGVLARALQLRGGTAQFDVISYGTPATDANDLLTFDVSWTGSQITFTIPNDVDVAVAINQGSHEESWNDEDAFAFLHRFVMYGLRDASSSTPGGGVDWDAVDRMINHQGRHIVGMSLNAGSNAVYWYEANGLTTDVVEVARSYSGLPNTHMTSAPASTFNYELPATRIGTDVLGVAIKDETLDQTYAWYDDGHYSVGYTSDLGFINTSATYTLPNAYGTSNPLKYDQLIDVAFSTAGAAFSWYTDGTRASGTAGDLDYYWTDDFVVPSEQNIGEVEAVALDWAGDNKVWARYRDGSVSKGNSGSLGADGYWPARPIAMTMVGTSTTTFYYATGWYRTFSVTPQNADGTNQTASGYWHSGDGSNPAGYRVPWDMLGLAQASGSAASRIYYYLYTKGAPVTDMVPGSEVTITYPSGYGPVDLIDVAANSSGNYYAYYADGKRSKGNSTNLHASNNLVNYSLPPGKTPANLVAVAMTDGGDVWAAYSDGTYSWGTDTDLDAHGVF